MPYRYSLALKLMNIIKIICIIHVTYICLLVKMALALLHFGDQLESTEVVQKMKVGWNAMC